MSYPTLGDALALATVAHHGQQYGNRPYIEHPIAVARLVLAETGNEHLGAAALLHDTVEDTFVTLELLGRYGYSDRVIDAVDGVTRRYGEVYMDFVRRAAVHPDSRLIKLADNTHNLSGLPAGDPREKRYLRARAILVATGGHDPWPNLVPDYGDYLSALP